LAREQLDDEIYLTGCERSGAKIAAREDNSDGTGTGSEYRAIGLSHEGAIGACIRKFLSNLDK